jgi:ABC-type transporter Mla maintaining outer membrane lipid asymmetry permease subunit MlaE
MAKWVRDLAEFKLKMDRGKSLFSWIKNILLLTASIKVIIELTVLQTVILTIIAGAAFYFLGWFDLNRFGLFQVENDLTSNKYNPHLQKINTLVHGQRKK